MCDGSVDFVGGTPESQREFLDTLSADTSDPNVPGTMNERRRGKTPPIANQFALGYTYQDVLDADQEGRPPAFTLGLGSACPYMRRRLIVTGSECPRYLGSRLRVSSLRTLSLVRATSQTALDSSIRAGDPGGHTAGLVGSVDVDTAIERMGPLAKTCSHFARRRDQGRHGRNHD